MQNLVDPHLLRTFIAVVETGSFSQAADRVRRTKSAISMQMRRLESLSPNAPLIARVGRRQRPTPRGQALYHQAVILMKLETELNEAIMRTKMSGVLRFGVPEDYVSSLLPLILAGFSDPDVQIDVCCYPSRDLTTLIAEEKIDLAIVSRAPDNLDVETIRREPIVWVTSNQQSLHDEPIVPLILFQEGCVTRQLALRTWASTGRSYRITASSESVAGILTLVRGGTGVAALARCSVPEGFRILGPEEGFPALTSIRIALLRSASLKSKPFAQHFIEKIYTSLKEKPVNEAD